MKGKQNGVSWEYAAAQGAKQATSVPPAALARSTQPNDVSSALGQPEHRRADTLASSSLVGTTSAVGEP